MSKMNPLAMSREIDNINKNISFFDSQIKNLENNQDRINESVEDLNEIKMNKLEIIETLEQIREEFKFLQTKVTTIDNSFRSLVSRNIDYVNKNKELFHNFLKNIVTLSEKKINILLHVFDCSTYQDYLLIDEKELKEMGFNSSEIYSLNRKCKEQLENYI